MTLIVARAARQAAIKASVSDWFESTSTKAEEPHTQPAMPEAAAKRQPHELDAVARGECRGREPRLAFADRVADAAAAGEQPHEAQPQLTRSFRIGVARERLPARGLALAEQSGGHERLGELGEQCGTLRQRVTQLVQRSLLSFQIDRDHAGAFLDQTSGRCRADTACGPGDQRGATGDSTRRGRGGRVPVEVLRPVQGCVAHTSAVPVVSSGL